MAELEVREEDLEERFVRSSGRGGQHVNKTASCAQVRHLPSGIEARCGRERSQSLNRFLARRELLEKIARSRVCPPPRMPAPQNYANRKPADSAAPHQQPLHQ